MPEFFDKRISTLINQQVPDFVAADHGTFVSFVKAYYEWMEQEGKLQEVVSDFDKYIDIDDTVDSFVEYFHRNFMSNIPRDLYSET